MGVKLMTKLVKLWKRRHKRNTNLGDPSEQKAANKNALLQIPANQKRAQGSRRFQFFWDTPPKIHVPDGIGPNVVLLQSFEDIL